MVRKKENSLIYKSKKSFFLAALLMITLVNAIVYYPGVHSKFEQLDDHLIIQLASNNTVHSQIPERPGFFQLAKYFIYKQNRIMMVGVGSQYLQARILGQNPLYHHLLVYFYAIMTGMFLFFGFSRLMNSVFAGGMCSLFVMQAPNTQTWVHIVRGEHLGMMLLSISIYFLSKNSGKAQHSIDDYIAILFYLLTSLVKESFFIVGPALAYLRCYGLNNESKINLNFTEKIKISLPYLIIFAIVIIANILVVLTFQNSDVNHGKEFVGGTSAEFITNIFSNKSLFSDLLRYSVWFLPVLGYVVYLLVSKSRPNLYVWRIVFVFSILIIFPQLILYSVFGRIMEGRYWLPMVIGLCVPNAVALKLLIEGKKKNTIVFLSVFFTIIWVGRCVQINWFSSKNHFYKTNAYERMVLDLSETLPKNGTIVIVAPPKTEFAYSFVYHLGMHKRSDVTAYLFQPEGSDNDKSFFSSGYDELSALDNKKVNAVIYINKDIRDKVKNKNWYYAERLKIKNVSYPQYFISLRRLRIEKIIRDFTYEILKSGNA